MKLEGNAVSRCVFFGPNFPVVRGQLVVGD